MDLSIFEEDNTKSCVIESEIPDVTKKEPCWIGIDEAGRGPVLGPMVYGICYSPISLKDKFKKMGFQDSKTLTEEQREALFTGIDGAKDLLGWMVHILSPTYISNSMLRRSKYNLNELSHDTAIGLIKKCIDRGVNVQEVYVDTVGLPEKYQAKLQDIFPNLTITVAKKADALYPVVSAASICAKVARDRTVRNWKFIEDIELEDNNYGSGYPNDPNTKAFMRNNLEKVFGFPQFVRFSWSTADVILQDRGVPVHWEDDDAEEDKKGKGSDSKNGPSVLSFFQAKPKPERKDKRHQFFNDRCLKPVVNL